MLLRRSLGDVSRLTLASCLAPCPQGGKAKAAKAPLAAANNASGGKTIEETYQKLSQVRGGATTLPAGQQRAPPPD